MTANLTLTGEWSGEIAEINISVLPRPTGPKISLSSEAWGEMLLTPREAARLAHVLLTHATQEDASTGSPMLMGWQAAAGGSQITGWQLSPDILT
jgi:hypothetical protein